MRLTNTRREHTDRDESKSPFQVTCKAPAIDVSAALHVVPPSFEAIKKAVTQAEITALAQPVHAPSGLVNFMALCHRLTPNLTKLPSFCSDMQD